MFMGSAGFGSYVPSPIHIGPNFVLVYEFKEIHP